MIVFRRKLYAEGGDPAGTGAPTGAPAAPTGGTAAADAAALAAAASQGTPPPGAATAAADALVAKQAADKAAAEEAARIAANDKAGVFTYAKTGHDTLDMALDFVGKAKLGNDHPAMIAAGAGNFDLLKAHFAQNPVPGWETIVAIGEKAFNEYLTQLGEKGAAEIAKAHDLAGGKENFEAALSWANTNAEPAEKEQFNAMMEQGGFAADAALFYIINQHKASLSSYDGSSAVSPTAAVRGGAPTGEKLNRVQFAAEAKKLYNKMGDSYVNSPEFAALGRRRG